MVLWMGINLNLATWPKQIFPATFHGIQTPSLVPLLSTHPHSIYLSLSSRGSALIQCPFCDFFSYCDLHTPHVFPALPLLVTVSFHAYESKQGDMTKKLNLDFFQLKIRFMILIIFFFCLNKQLKIIKK